LGRWFIYLSHISSVFRVITMQQAAFLLVSASFPLSCPSELSTLLCFVIRGRQTPLCSLLGFQSRGLTSVFLFFDVSSQLFMSTLDIESLSFLVVESLVFPLPSNNIKAFLDVVDVLVQ